MRYEDFVLEATPTASGRQKGATVSFRVRVSHSLAGSSAEAESSRYNREELGRLKQVVTAARSARATRDLALPDVDPLYESVRMDLLHVGERLAHWLLPPETRRLLSDSLSSSRQRERGLRIRLVLEGPLRDVPWEYLLLNQGGAEPRSSDFLALSQDVSIVRHQGAGRPLPRPRAKPPLTILAGLSNPEGLASLDLDRERRGIEDALRRTPHSSVIWRDNPTLEELVGGVQHADIFHFGGHGGFRPARGSPDPGRTRSAKQGPPDARRAPRGPASPPPSGQGSLMLCDEFGNARPCPGDDLGARLHDIGVRAAVLGACESGRRDETSTWAGVADDLIKAGLVAVVGMQHNVSDESAITFAAELYAGLAEGLSFDEVVTKGRRKLHVLGGLDWGNPVLHLREGNGVIFSRAATGRGAGRSAAPAKAYRVDPVAAAWLDFSAYIADRTRYFADRSWVFGGIKEWLATRVAPSVLILKGDPGSGKTAIAAGLAGTPDRGPRAPTPIGPAPYEVGASADGVRVSAYHFCSAQELTWLDPRKFCESLALQLAARHPLFAQALAEKAGSQRLRINVATPRVELVGGVRTEIVTIRGVDARDVSPEEAFVQLIREPLEALARGAPDDLVLILVDALDEDAGDGISHSIISLLARSTRLPSNVRLLLTSRRNVGVEKNFPGAAELALSTPDARPQNLADVRRFVERRLDEDERLRGPLAALGGGKAAVMDAIAERAEGNFLWARFVLDSVARSQHSFAEVPALPGGLDELYRQSLDRSVGKPGGEVWRRDHAPLLGVLSVARAPLTFDQLKALTGQPGQHLQQQLGHLQPFMADYGAAQATNEAGPTYRLYHQSFVEFLHRRHVGEGSRCINEYWLDKEESHGRIAAHYFPLRHEGWRGIDGYGVSSLADHLYLARKLEHAVELIDESWFHVRRQRDRGSKAGFSADVTIAWRAATDGAAPDASTLARLHAAMQAAYDNIYAYADADLKILVWLGRADEALSRVHDREVPRLPELKLNGLYAIYDALAERGQPLDDVKSAIESVLGASGVDGEVPGFVERLLNSGDRQSALRVAREAQDPADRSCALGVAASSVYAEDPALAEDLFAQAALAIEELGDAPARSPILWSHMSALVDAGLYGRAISVSETIPGPSMRAGALGQLAATLSGAGAAQAGQLFDQARDAAREVEDPIEKARALGELAQLLAKAGCYGDALTTADEVSPAIERSEAFVAVAEAMVRAGHGCGRDLFRALRSTIDAITERSSQTWHLQHLAFGLANAGLSNEARETAAEIAEPTVQADVLMGIAGILAGAGHFEEARRAADAVGRADHRARALAYVAVALAKAGRDAEALKVCDAIGGHAEDQPVRAAVLQALALELARRGETLPAERRFEEARRLVQRQTDPGEYCLTLVKLGAVAAAAGHPAAILLFDLARAITQVLRGASKRGHAQYKLADALARAGLYRDAEDVAASINHPHAQALALCAVASAVLANDRAHALELFAEARRTAEAIPHREVYRPWTLSEVAVSYARAGLFDDALEVIGDLKDERSRSIALNALSGAFADAKRYADARTMIAAINESYYQVDALAHLGKAMARAGAPDSAEAIERARADVKQMKVGYERTVALAGLAAAMHEARDPREEATFEEAEAEANQLDNESRSQALAALTGALVEAGRVRDAERVALEVRHLPDRDRARRRVFLALVSGSRFADALSFFGMSSLDEYVDALADCALAPDRAALDFLGVLRDSLEVAAWVRADWREVWALLSGALAST